MEALCPHHDPQPFLCVCPSGSFSVTVSQRKTKSWEITELQLSPNKYKKFTSSSPYVGIRRPLHRPSLGPVNHYSGLSSFPVCSRKEHSKWNQGRWPLPEASAKVTAKCESWGYGHRRGVGKVHRGVPVAECEASRPPTGSLRYKMN